jgi:peroxiredoxin/tetratricopeptide (TPR) repeat protein
MYELALQHLAGSDSLQRVVLLIGRGPYSPQMDRLLRQVFRSHTSRRVRACAGLALFRALRADRHCDRYVPEMIEILERLNRMYPGLRVEGKLVGETAEEELTRWRCLAVGAKAQEVVGEDQEGNILRLTDHRGKVVVLDFWADYSPHCRNMYAHFRALVERLSGKPFKLIGVNCDETPERSASLTKSGVVTWTTLYDGVERRLMSQWMLDRVPAAFVMDGKGTIRFTNVWREQLDDAVQSLLEEPLLQFPADVIPWESEWRWYHGASPPPDDWRSVGFDDTDWKTGTAPLGYGRPGVKTLLDYGDIDRKRIVACFRKTFQVKDVGATSRLILQLEADDGAVVYLNGQEVYRDNLPETVDWETQAILPAYQPVAVDLAGRLVSGMNTLAVAVHQVSPQSGDLYFDLALSSRSLDPHKILGAESLFTRLRFCQLAAGLSAQDPALDEVLNVFAADSDVQVKAWALVARIQRAADPDGIEIPQADPETASARHVAASMLNHYVWEIVERGDFSQEVYQRAVRAAHAMWRVGRTGTAADAAIANTYGVALYRAGQFEKAIEQLNTSSELAGENPIDLSFLALSLEKLGRAQEARLTYEKAAAYPARERWAAMDAAAKAFEEAKAVFAR